ncbi:MAG: helix-turn-helix transcriptional regulator [Acidimicrobiaceae bacterium]|nr:helix-turn-helix transcriptional regulator [Acidimicrobiaceae bacterium]
MTTLTLKRPQFDRRCITNIHEDLPQDFWKRRVLHKSVVERSGVGSPPQVLDRFDQLTQEYRRLSLADLLDRLKSRFGIEWNEIAKVAGISRQSVTKWRNGQASPDNRRFGALCRLAALAELIQSRGGDPARWLKVKLQIADENESHLSISDVLATGNFRVALQHFDRELSDDELLREVFPRYRSDTGGLAAIELRDDVFVVSLDELGLLSTGEDAAEAQEDLLLQVRDYIDDWHAFLRGQEPHTSHWRIVNELEQADRNSSLTGVLFGR